MTKQDDLDRKQTDENSISIKLIRQDIGYLTSGFDDMKNAFKDLKTEITNGFVRKEQHESLVNRVSSLENLKDWGIRVILGAIILAVLAIIGLK